MEIKQFHIDDIIVYLCPLVAAQSSRQSEKITEEQLLSVILPKNIEVKYLDSGKPYLSEGYISISHSKKYLVIAVSMTKEIGVDIEQLNERLQRVKHKFLSTQELEGLKKENLLNLALCWSAKEAIYKLVGEKAGALGENITILTDEIGENNVFYANINQEKFVLNVLEANKDYEIVLACMC